ncbi:MAG: hypothetical protein HPY66_0708 [Firmicutes bacterium]|nr:hypothetical protein [Bacillota bacterium]MDI6705643.1 DUF819 family protein [Bacillota bacterium]
MQPLITSQGAILAVMASIVAVSFLLQRLKFFKSFGPAIICIIIGIILANFNIVPHWHDVYGVFFQYAIPVALTMFLLNVNLKEWIKLSKQPLLAMAFAVISVCAVTLLAGLYFAPRIPEGWKIAGMFIGTYTGGSSNLTAIGTGLNASPTTFASANAADYIIGLPTIVLFFAIPGILARSKWFKRVWPYSLTEEELSTDDDTELFSKKEWSITDIALLFAIGFIVAEVATALSQGFSALTSGAVRILLITTLALILAQFKPIREIKGNMDVGYFVALFFLVIIGFLVDINEFMNSAPLIAVFCFFVIIGSLALHIALCRLFKIKYQYVLISIVAAIADGTTAALVAGTGKWKSIISVAVVLGAIGMALGNYVGIGVAYLLKAIIGG